MPGAPATGTALVDLFPGAGGAVSGAVRLHLPAGHSALSGGRCRLTLNPGLALVETPFRRVQAHTVLLDGIGSGPADLSLRFRGQFIGGRSLGHGYAAAAEWFCPAAGGWFPYPGSVRVTVQLRPRPGWSALLSGAPAGALATGAHPGEWRIPPGVSPALVLGRWTTRPWFGGRGTAGAGSVQPGLLAAHPETGPALGLVRTVAAHLAARNGPWPYGHVHVAQMSGLPLEGLSLPGIVLLNPDRMPAGHRVPAGRRDERGHRVPREPGDQRRRPDRPYLAGLLAHELAHQWWGNGLPAAGPAETWLIESLAEWERMQYLSAAQGPAAGQAVLAEGLGLYRAAAGLVGPLCLHQAPALHGRHPIAFDGLAFGMGLLLLCVLDRAAGPGALAAALRRLAAGRGTLGLAALCRALDPAGDGARWLRLSRRLMGRPGLPSLAGWPGLEKHRLDTICIRFLNSFRGGEPVEGESGQ